MQVQDGIRATAGHPGTSPRFTAFHVMSAATLLLSLTLLPLSPAAASADRDSHLLPGVRLLAPPGEVDLDRRTAWIEPTPAQRALVEDLGARVRWSRFGTPASLALSEDAGGAENPGNTGEARDVRPKGPGGADAVQARSDPPAGGPEIAARRFVAGQAALFRLSDAGVDRLEVVRNAPLPGTSAHVVTFRQRFESPRGLLPAGDGGLITVGVTGDGAVTYASSSSYGSPGAALPQPRLSPEDAWIAAATSLRRAANHDTVRPLGPASGSPAWHRFSVTGFAQIQHVRLVAVGAPRGGRALVRPAYEANVVDVRNGSALAATAFVDAVTGEVLIRHDRVDHLHGGTESSAPHRHDAGLHPALPTGCPHHLLGCGVRLSAAATVPSPVHAVLLGRPGGAAAHPVVARPADPWMRSGCEISRVGQATAESAYRYVRALHAGLRAWLRGLGLRPEDGPAPVTPHVHSGALTGGYPTYLGRNDAVRVTLQSGLPGLESHYLFEPVAGRWYGRCADGALDPTLVAHEYLHGITERLVGGPDAGIVSAEGRAIAESWSDLLAAEFVQRHRIESSPAGAIGGYVAGNPVRGLRNFSLTSNPLNATNLGYGSAAPWSDGEIWTAVNRDLREALGADTWLRLLLDSLPLQQSRTTMPDARDALLAADRMRYDGANSATLWRVFARRGFGQGAQPSEAGEATPSFVSPVEAEGVLRVEAEDPGDGRPILAAVYAGRFGAGGSAPVADTDPSTTLADQIDLAPGRYELTWTAPGYGMGRARADIDAGRTTTVSLRPQRNLASAAAGARAYDRVPRFTLVGQTDGSTGDGTTEPDGTDSTGQDGGDGTDSTGRDGGDGSSAGSRNPWTSAAGEPVPGRPRLGHRTLTQSVTDVVTGLTGLGQSLLPGPDMVPPPQPPTRSGEGTTKPSTNPARTSAGRQLPPGGPAGVGVSTGTSTGARSGVSSEEWAGPATRAARVRSPLANPAAALIDDSEAFGWTAYDLVPDASGATVTVDLAGARPHRVGRVVISALPRPEHPGAVTPSAFSTPRRFAIEVCTETTDVLCATGPALATLTGDGRRAAGGSGGTDQESRGTEDRWTRIYTSPEDAFPAGRPRPVPADLTFRSFDVPDAWATHVRLLVLQTQCTGNPAYHGAQSADPLTSADCRTTPAAHEVTVAELMVYGNDRA